MLAIILISLLSTSSATPHDLFLPRTENVDTNNDGYRLPNTTIPSKYDINLDVPEAALTGGNTSYTGSVNILFRVIEPTDKIILHSLVDIHSISISNSSVEIINSTVDTIRETITILTAVNLTVNLDYNLEINYTANLDPVSMEGFYRSEYTVNGTKEYLGTTQFQATHARKAFPCFDEPALKAVFEVTLQYPVGFEAVGNTPVLSNIPTTTSKTTIFQDTPVMSTYLLAFTISKFVCNQYTGGAAESIPIGVCSRSLYENDTGLALDFGVQALNALDAWTGYPYRRTGIGKMDQFAIPDFSAGAMENWGLVTYREYLLIYNAEYTSNLYKQRMLAVIAHEFAHMWFGNLVTLRWWSYTFLNEGFARYFQYFLLSKIASSQSFEIEKQFIIEQQQTAFVVDSHSSSASLTSDVFTPVAIKNKFSTLSYNKGASVLRMVENLIGPTVFQSALQLYLSNNALSTTTPEILWNTIGYNLPTELLPDGLNLTQVIDTWTNSPGFPVIVASLNGNNVVLSQKRFLYNTSSSDSTQWYVPITYITSNQTSSINSIWLRPNGSITLDTGNSSWIILNHNSAGYYRVHYDAALRAKLVRALLDDHQQISDLNRAQIVDDTFNLARARYVTYPDAFELLRYLKNETSYYPWYVAIRGLNYLAVRLGLESDLGRRVATLLLEQFDDVRANVSSVDLNAVGHVDSLKWPLLWSTACRFGHPVCIAEAKKQFREFRDNGASINPNIRDVVYCNALRYSDNSTVDWEFLWNRLHTVDQPQENLYILMGLGCTRNETLLSYYLDQSINSSSIIRVQDVATVWSAVYSSSSVGLQVAFEKFRTKHSDIINYYSGGISLLSAIADRFTTEAHVTQLQNLANQHESNSTIGTTLKSALASTKENLKWQSGIRNDLESYFGIAGPSSATSFGISMMLLFLSFVILV